MFNKRPKLEFFSLIPEVTKLAPIVPAYEIKQRWFEKVTEDFVNKTKEPNFGHTPFIHTAKCPGVFNLMRYGWIMTTWQDIIIKTNGDKQTFEWRSAVDQKKRFNKIEVGDAVGYHPASQFSDYQGGWDDSLNCILKIQTPWRCIVPKGYYLLEGPIPYSEEKRFTTVPGFFSQEYGVSQMNVQLKWHVLNGETLLKAGTPIAHYMLIPKVQADMSVMEATPNQIEAENITQLELLRRNVSDRSKSKCIFARMFGK
jgi:hypothetical protein